MKLSGLINPNTKDPTLPRALNVAMEPTIQRTNSNPHLAWARLTRRPELEIYNGLWMTLKDSFPLCNRLTHPIPSFIYGTSSFKGSLNTFQGQTDPLKGLSLLVC